MSIREKLKQIKWLRKLVINGRSLFKSTNRVNVCKTLYINFKTQRFSDAIKFPIIIYGKVKIHSLSGKITIEAPIKNGMIRLGYNSDLFSYTKGCALLVIDGELIFRGSAIISIDYTLDVSGKCIIGECVAFGNGVKLRCWNNIEIGDFSRVAIECQLFDTNFHYTKNIETGRIYRSSVRIIIGKFCWIGNRSTIMKGTVLPDYSIIGGNSLLNKDYSKDAPFAPTIAGVPAKVIGSGNVRIFDIQQEAAINDFFKSNSDATFYQSTREIEDESSIIKAAFNSL